MEVDHVLVVLQTDPELGPALPAAVSVACEVLAALPVDIFAP